MNCQLVLYVCTSILLASFIERRGRVRILGTLIDERILIGARVVEVTDVIEYRPLP